MPDLLIVVIEATAAAIFLISTFYSFQMYTRTKQKTDIWLLITAAIVIAFLNSTFSALEWFYNESPTLDIVGECLAIFFSIVWIYIAYRFISLGHKNKKTSQ